MKKRLSKKQTLQKILVEKIYRLVREIMEVDELEFPTLTIYWRNRGQIGRGDEVHFIGFSNEFEVTIPNLLLPNGKLDVKKIIQTLLKEATHYRQTASFGSYESFASEYINSPNVEGNFTEWDMEGVRVSETYRQQVLDQIKTRA